MEFTNGDTIEYLGINLNWIPGKYVGKNPVCEKEHVILNQRGHVRAIVGSSIRKPKVKKEGWINIWSNRIANPEYGFIYTSEELAKARCTNDPLYIATIRIEWYE